MVDLVTEGGRRYANVAGELQEVVIANKADVNSLNAQVRLCAGRRRTLGLSARHFSRLCATAESLPTQ
jgi:hypothetical protein